jgi:TLD
VDGFEATKFHELCDNKGATVSLIKTTENHNFGGFTTVSWDTSGNFKEDKRSFLFSVDKL